MPEVFSSPSYNNIPHNTRMAEQSIYDRIIIARTEAGQPVTLMAIGKDVGISHAAVAKWKRGLGVKLAHVMKIATSAGVCVQWIYTGKGPMHPPSKSTQALIDELESLDPESRAAVLRFARFRAADSEDN